MTYVRNSSPDHDGRIAIPDNVKITLGDPEVEHRTCTECARDCISEAIETEGGFRMAFVCARHGVHTAVDPFE